MLDASWLYLSKDLSATTGLESIDSSFDEHAEIIELVDRIANLSAAEAPATVGDAETVENMNFSTEYQAEAPTDMFKSTGSKVKNEYMELFDGPASRAFFAYLPLSYWIQVVDACNKYIETMNLRMKTVDLKELLQAFGIMFYMQLVDRGEIDNYWGFLDPDTRLFGEGPGLEMYMSKDRFKRIRQVVPVTADSSFFDILTGIIIQSGY